MKRVLILSGMALCMMQGHAQNSHQQLQQLFDDFRKEAHQEFGDFRRRCMEEYLEFVRDPWKEFYAEEPLVIPKDDMLPPVVIPKEEQKRPIQTKPIVIDEVIKPIVIEPRPAPVAPIEEVPVEVEKYQDFTFFGTAARVRFDSKDMFHLLGTSPASVSLALLQLLGKEYDNMLLDCLRLREERQLSDWAYLQMLKALSDEVCGRGTNEATLLLMYLYMQSGYKARLGTDGARLYMLYASAYDIFDRPYYTIEGVSYYSLDDLPDNLNICSVGFPKEQTLSLVIPYEQQFDVQSPEGRLVKSERNANQRFTVKVNKNLIDFYQSYPTSMYGDNIMTRWAMYANTPLAAEVKQQVYPSLQGYIKGLSQLDAVNVLLNFVQYAFPYGYDDEIWGHDRAFFAEETLFYPRSDCEDHAILFSRLVRDLLGLKVLLVFYPGHLAAAVHFPTDVAGDFISLQGQRYTICDPTYIGAPVGRTMPEMDNRTAKVILLE